MDLHRNAVQFLHLVYDKAEELTSVLRGVSLKTDADVSTMNTNGDQTMAAFDADLVGDASWLDDNNWLPPSLSQLHSSRECRLRKHSASGLVNSRQ